MQEGGHARKTKLADKYRGIEASVALFGLDDLAAFSIRGRESFEKEGKDDLVGGVLLKVQETRKVLSAEGTGSTMIE